MTTLAIVSIVSMLGWLVLAVASYRSYDLPKGKMLRQIAMWVVLFTIIALMLKGLGIS